MSDAKKDAALLRRVLDGLVDLDPPGGTVEQLAELTGLGKSEIGFAMTSLSARGLALLLPRGSGQERHMAYFATIGAREYVDSERRAAEKAVAATKPRRRRRR